MGRFLSPIELTAYAREFGFIRDAIRALNNEVNSISIQRLDQELLDTIPHNVGPDPESGFKGDGITIFFIDDKHSTMGTVEQKKTIYPEFKMLIPSTWLSSWFGREQCGETVANALLRKFSEKSLGKLKYILWIEHSPRAGKRIIIFKVPKITSLIDFFVSEMQRAAQKVADRIKEQVDSAS